MHLHSLISLFFTQRNLAFLAVQNVPMNMQSDLNLCWMHMLEGMFSGIVAQMCVYTAVFHLNCCFWDFFFFFFGLILYKRKFSLFIWKGTWQIACGLSRHTACIDLLTETATFEELHVICTGKKILMGAFRKFLVFSGPTHF